MPLPVYMITIETIVRSMVSYLFLYKVMSLEIEQKSRKENILYAIGLVLLFIINVAFNILYSWETEFGTERYAPDIKEDLAIMIFLILMFKGNVWKKIYYAVFGYVLVLLSDFIVGYIISFTILEMVFHYVTSTIEMLIIDFSAVFLYFLFYRYLRVRKAHIYDIDNKDWKLFAVFSIVVCCFFYYTKNIVPLIGSDDLFMYVSIEYIQLGIMIMVFLLFGRYHMILAKKNQELIDTKLELQIEEFEGKLQEELTEANNENRKLRHDLMNHFSILERMIAENPNKAIEYVGEMIDHVEVVSYANTGNKILDYIINSKAAKAHQLKIPFEYEIKGLLSFINDFDLISLLGNALDNAIEAQEFVDKPWIHMEIGNYEDTVYVKIENAYDASRMQLIENTFISTKDDKEKHGFGMQKIRDICVNYHGILDVSEEGSTFHLTLSFLNQK